MGILGKINWVDVLIIAIIVRALYVGIKRGFIIEIFKGLGTLFALYITLHYCSGLAQFLHQKMNLPTGMEIMTYGFLWGTITLVAKLVRDTMLMLVHVEPQGLLNKVGSGALALLRGVLLASLTLVYFEVAQSESLRTYVSKSLLGTSITRVAPHLYENCYENVIVKLFPKEKLNISILKGKNISPASSQ